jgi:hypothetical protein
MEAGNRALTPSGLRGIRNFLSNKMVCIKFSAMASKWMVRDGRISEDVYPYYK